MKPARILFFVKGSSPTPSDLKAANAINADVVFRNAYVVPVQAHALEACDGVAGAVPKIYADEYPEAKVAVASKKAEVEALSKKVGDKPAPKPKEPEPTKAEAKVVDEKAPVSKK